MTWLLGLLVVWGVPILLLALALLWAMVHPIENDPMLGWDPEPGEEWNESDQQLLDAWLREKANG